MSLRNNAARIASLLTLVFLASQVLVPAYAATYTMTLNTNLSSYSGIQPIVISGTISPAPGPNTGVIITIKDSGGAIADADEAIPNPTTGNFNYTSIPGGNAAWTAGTMQVNATWGGDGATVVQVASFTYSPAASTTSSSSTSTTTVSSSSTSRSTSVTSSSSTSSTSSISSSSSTTTSSTVPEFPSGALALLALVAVALVAALSGRLAPRSAGSASAERKSLQTH